MTGSEKLIIAHHLSRLGVYIIEAGYPAFSPGNLDAICSISIEVVNHPDGDDGHIPVICALSRCNKADIDAAWEAVQHAKGPRIHTFIGTSEIHIQHKLRKTEEEVVRIAREMVAYARSLGCLDVEFSPKDTDRSDWKFLYHILEKVIKAGSMTLNIPDTVGFTNPCQFHTLIADIKANTCGIENVIISTHRQNDLGFASANTFLGAHAGARQVEVTINGIGERAGNASLEVVIVIKCHQDYLGALYTGINTRHIVMASKMVAEYTGLNVQPHKAIVGANAFSHESGIHQDGMLKHKGTYEIISPEDIGLSHSNESGIVLGKLSGRHALRSKLLEFGYDISGKELDDVFKRFKQIADKKKVVLYMAGVHIHDIESYIRIESQDTEDVVESHEAVESQDVEDVNTNDGEGCNAGKPYIGMEFTTHEDAFSFYNAYALVTGFDIRKTSSTMSRKEPKEVMSRTFVCNKEGNKCLTDKGEPEREIARKRETRVGCNTRMRITLTKSKIWTVSKFIEEHNSHELTSPNKVMKHRSHKTKHRSKSVKNLIECLHSEGMTPSNISRIINVASGSHGERVTPQQCHDYLRTQRKNNIGHECFSVVQKFENKKLSDPEFYFAIELDHIGTMRSIFWADGRSRTSYLQFGDVIIFDVTYKTNKLCLPFAPFTGVNHHRQSTLFGCALLADEEEETFVWLFTEWLKCMHGQAPISIITDQDIAIGNAVKRVFPNTCHRFCSWHVGKHVVEQVPRLQRLYGEDFIDYYNRWYYSSTVQKAEQRWKELKEKYDIDENDSSWLSTMYQKRHHWIPAFLKGTFFAGMTSSQRSESINSFFDSYVNSQTRLSEFVSQYDKALAARRASELDEDFMTMNIKPVMCFSHSIEIQVANCYTKRILNMFQDELKGCLQLFREEEKKDASIIVYSVGLVNEERSKWHQVVYDQGGELKVNCTCALFETTGLLCKHILHIMMFAHQVQVIPECYILHRWTIDARYRNIGIGNIMLGRSSICNEDQWNILKTWAVRAKFNSALELTARSNTLLTELDAKLLEFMIKAEQKIKDKHIDDNAFVSQVGSNAHVSQMIDHVTIRDPPGPVTTKGRPSKASRLRSRKEEAIEKRQKQQRTCQRCFQKGHYRTSCTNPPATK